MYVHPERPEDSLEVGTWLPGLGAGNRTQVLCKNRKYCGLPSISSNPGILLFKTKTSRGLFAVVIFFKLCDSDVHSAPGLVRYVISKVRGRAKDRVRKST